MPEITSIERAKTVVADLFQNLAIERVFCIDDVYAEAWKFEDVQAAELELDSKALLAVMPEFGASVPDERDVRRHQFRKLWDRLDPTVQHERSKTILASARSKDEVGRNDDGVASTLQDIVGKERLAKLSPAAWEKQAQDIIAATATSRALILFDQDLSEAGGSPTGGMVYIKTCLPMLGQTTCYAGY